MDFRLRLVRDTEGPVIASVFGLARATMTYLPVLHTPEEDVAYFSDQVLPVSRVTVAEAPVSGGSPSGAVPEWGVVGFSAVRDDWLHHLYVAPAFHGRGVGSALLRQAMAENPGGLSLWVFEENRRARALYERAGFEVVERTDGRANEERVPDVRMRWFGSGG